MILARRGASAWSRFTDDIGVQDRASSCQSRPFTMACARVDFIFGLQRLILAQKITRASKEGERT